MAMTPKQRVLEQVPVGVWFIAMLGVSFGFAVLVVIGADDLYPSESDGPFYLAGAAGMALFSVLAAIGAIGGRILSALVELLDDGDPTRSTRSD
jgi:hypothetical protein